MLCFRQSLSPSLYIKRLRCVDCGTSQTFYYTFGVTHCHIVYHYLYLVSTNIPSFPHLGQFNGDHTQFGLSPVELIMCSHRNPSLLHESLITASNNNSKFIFYISIEFRLYLHCIFCYQIYNAHHFGYSPTLLTSSHKSFSYAMLSIVVERSYIGFAADCPILKIITIISTLGSKEFPAIKWV